MPRRQTVMGEVIIYDGGNAAELAEAVGVAETPAPAEDGSLTLLVPFPFGHAEETRLAVGDGLTVRVGGFLPMPAEQVKAFSETSS